MMPVATGIDRGTQMKKRLTRKKTADTVMTTPAR